MFVQLCKACQSVYFVLTCVKIIFVTVFNSSTLEVLLGDGENHSGLQRDNTSLLQSVEVEHLELHLLTTLDIRTLDRPLRAPFLVLDDLRQPQPDLALVD